MCVSDKKILNTGTSKHQAERRSSKTEFICGSVCSLKTTNEVDSELMEVRGQIPNSTEHREEVKGCNVIEYYCFSKILEGQAWFAINSLLK